MADVPGKFFSATKVRTGVSPSSPGSLVGEPLPPVNPPGTSLNSVGLTMPSAFTVSNSPLTSNGTIGVAGAGTVGQYIRGDGSLADFPESSGGGSSVSYYLNGSVAQGTIGGVAYKELNKVPILGAGTDFTINANGYIASFITDAGDPNLLEIPAGNWNFETFFSASSGGGSPTFYVELYKVNSGGTATLIASNSTFPELIAFGTNVISYFSTLAVPTTALALTDRLAIRYYVTHSGRTITLHTEDNHLCQIITTFTTGLTALNGLTAQIQNFAVGTSGTDFAISSATATHTFNLPTASATNRGALSSADWALFTQAYNDKINSASVTGTTTKTLTLVQQDGGEIQASWSDLNTDAVTSVFGRTGAVIAVSGDYTTAQVTESGNLYFTNARAIASVLTGYTSGAGTISAADTILSAIQKLNGNIGGLVTGVSSVNGQTGVVTLTTTNIAEGTNLYYTEARVNANTNVAANTAARHAAVTLGTANGLSLSIQQLSLGLASAGVTGALSGTDWSTFNSKQQALNGTGFVKISGTTISYDNSTYLTTAAAASTYLPLVGGTMTGVITTPNGTFGIIIGDDSRLADRNIANTLFLEGVQNNDRGYINFSETTGNALGAINGGDLTWRGNVVLHAANFNSYAPTLGGTGATGIWSIAITGNAGTANTWTTARTITIGNTGKSVNGSADVAWSLAEIGAYAATNPSAFIALTALSGVAPIQYNNSTGAISITQASASTNGFLSSTDWNTFNNKTSNVGTVTSVAALTLGTSGTDLSSTVANGTTTPVITLNVPTASAANRGALSAADWTTFNNKQNALTNPVTGTGTTNYLPKFTGTSTIGDSQIFDNGNVAIGNTSPNNNTISTFDALTIGKTSTSSSALVFTNGNSTIWGFNYANASKYTFSSSNVLAFETGASWTERMRIFDDGNVLIQSGGTFTNNGARLQVSGEGRFTNSDGADLIRYAATGVNTNFATKIVSGANDVLVFRRQHVSSGALDIMSLGFNGNVGIGTIIPGAKLEVNGIGPDLGPGINIPNIFVSGASGFQSIGFRRDADSNGGWFIGTSHSVVGDFGVYQNQGASAPSNRLSISTSGNVGIGTASPLYKLDVLGASGNVTTDTSNGTLINIDGGSITSTNFGVGIGFVRTGSQMAFIKAARENTSDEAGFLSFATQTGAGAHPERMRITSSGNVLIGSPPAADNGAKLQVSGNGHFSQADANVYIQSTSGSGNNWQFQSFSDGNLYINRAGVFSALNINGSTGAATFSSSVGIGGVTPTSRLDVAKSASDTLSRANSAMAIGDFAFGAGLMLQQRFSAPYGFMMQATNSTVDTFYPLLLNPNGGNVGIGTASPAYKLDINALGYGIQHYGNSTNILRTYAGSSYQIIEATTSTGVSQFGYLSGNFFVEAGGSERMRITSAGELQLKQSSNSAQNSVIINTTLQNAMTLNSSGFLILNGTTGSSRITCYGDGYFSGGIQTGNPYGTTSANWLLGRFLTETTSANGSIRVQIGSKYYNIAAEDLGTVPT